MINKLANWLIHVVSRLPFWWHYTWATVFYLVIYYVARYRKNVVRNNLQMAFPTKTDKERLKIEKKFYKHLCDYFVETMKLLTMSPQQMLEHFHITNPELVQEYLDKGRSVFAYAAHIGNWEYFIAWPYIHNNCTVSGIFQPQSNKLMNDISFETRSRGGIVMTESQKSFRKIIQNMREGINTIMLIIGDQSPHRGAQKHWTNFFGMDTPFLVGPPTIAQKSNQVLVYPYFTQDRRGHYNVEYKLITDDPNSISNGAIIDRFAALVEDNVRQEPHLWLWSHRRWKHKHEDFPDNK